jgi:oleate hydratase
MSTYYFVGSGIAALAGAAYLIRDGNVAGSDIVLLEESDDFGGALDAHGDATTGYFMSGSRMFEHEYRCTFDLLSSIPSTSDAGLSVTAETDVANGGAPWYNTARLIDKHGAIVDAHPLGFSERDRLAILSLIARPEKWFDAKSIRDCFADDFFHTNFWFEWCTLFAFQPWHSAIEFRRYLLRFLHHFSTIDTQEGVYRTLYNQYDSIAVPLVKWLRERGVTIRFNSVVTNLGFARDRNAVTVTSIEMTERGEAQHIATTERDAVFVTIGSMTAEKSFGSMSSAPVIERGKTSGAWRLWEMLANGRPSFGKPATFDAHIDQSLWESFTVTDTSPTFFERMHAFSGSEAGRGGLITFKDSNWLVTLSIFGQPFFRDQPTDAFVWWGYGLFNNTCGNYMKKTMAECTGSEILEEVLGHLHFNDIKEAVLASSNVIPCMMPYITSQFLVRAAGDRPNVVPDTSTNLAFLGQFSELPDDVVFTVEYSIRSAQTAVYTLLKLDRKPLPMYKGAHDPKILLDAFVTLHR